MPLHDWTQVSAGSFHGFHTHLISEIARSLNNGILPEPFYADPEQVAGKSMPDVVTLETDVDWMHGQKAESTGGTAIAQEPPSVSLSQVADEEDLYAQRRNRVTIRHTSDDTVVAWIEIVSSGNKSSTKRLQQFVDKAYDALEQGIHLLIIDPYPPGNLDQQGIHGAIWHEIDTKSPFAFPDDRNRTAVAYQAIRPSVAWIEPMAVGQPLPEMPLFITPDRYVTLPLEDSYARAFEAVPKRWRKVLEVK